MDEGSTPPPTADGRPAQPSGGVLSANPPRNGRQVLYVLGTMAVFFIGLVIVASWAAGHG